MTPETSFQSLYQRLLQLRELLGNLRTTVVEDKPQRQERALADHFSDGLDDMLGWLEQAMAALLEGQMGAKTPSGQALGHCHGHVNQLEQRYLELISYHRLGSLVRLGRREQGEWLAWAQTVRSGLEEAQPVLAALRGDLLACWQELVSSLRPEQILVQNSVVGQQITPPR